MTNSRPFTSGLPVSRRVRSLLVFVAAGCVALGCDRGAPTAPLGSPLGPPFAYITIRHINDSTIAYDVNAHDTIPIVQIVALIESPNAPGTSTHFFGTNFGPGSLAETSRFSPRYSLRFSDTLPSRPVNAQYYWGVIVGNSVNGYQFSYGEFFSGTNLTIGVAGLPAVMQQIGLDLTVQPRSRYPIRAVRAFVDSGSASEQSFGPVPVDSALFNGTIAPDFELWIPGPLTNGQHVMTIAATDSAGRQVSLRQSVTVNIPTRQYRLSVIAIAGAVDTRANGINNAGVIAGTFVNPDATTQAMRWANGVVQLLPGPTSSSGDVINDSGVVAGYIGHGQPQGSDVVWRDTIVTRLAPPAGSGTVERINSRGDLLYYDGVFRNGVFTSFPVLDFFLDMNDAGVIVGEVPTIGPPYVAAGLNPAAFSIGSPRLPIPLPPTPHFPSSHADFINNAGQVIGVIEGSPVPFLWDNGTSHWTLNPFGLGIVRAMNNANQVLGQLTDGSIAIWTIGGSTTRVSFDAAGWTIDLLKGLNNSGQIIAHGVNAVTGQKAALLLDPM
jgi:hypothetical protein